MENRIFKVILAVIFFLPAFFLTALPDASDPKRSDSRIDPGLFIIDGHTHDLVARMGSEPRQGGLRSLFNSGVNGIVLFFPLDRVKATGVSAQIVREKEFVLKEAAKKGIRAKFVKTFTPGERGDCLQILPALEYTEINFDDKLDIISRLHEVGIRAITLYDSGIADYKLLADTTGKTTDPKLKKELNNSGRRIIKMLNEFHVRIDITHLDETLQLQVIRASTEPVFASHSNIRGVAHLDSNLSDEVCSMLTRKKGLALLTFDRAYLFASNGEKKSGIDKLLEHIDYFKKKFGPDHIGIGSDYGGSGRNAPPDLFTAACFKQITKALIRKRYSSEDAGKILGGNLVRFFSSPDHGGKAKMKNQSGSET